MNSADILRVWEVGREQDPVERAITILAAALPGSRRDDIASLSIGRRNQLLLAERARLFGHTLDVYGECSQCGAPLEFEFESGAVPTDAVLSEPPVDIKVDAGEFQLTLRALNSEDLAAAGTGQDVDSAIAILLRRSIVEAKRGGLPREVECLPPGVVSTVASAIADADPFALISISITCPACDGGCQIALDIASFFWEEISAEATRLCRQVHALATAYGWPERDILEMSRARRQTYLELIA